MLLLIEPAMTFSRTVSKRCRQPQTYTYCLEYVSGFGDNMMLVQRIKGVSASLFCLPYNFKMGDAVDAILAYGQANPEKREAHISAFTWNVLKETYPCP